MSIDIRDFEERTADELAEVSNPERVLAFLATYSDRAWKATEIARRSGVNEHSIHSVLSRLEDRSLVRHKGPFWAITDDEERLHRAYDIHRITQLFNDLLGEEDPAEWLEAANDS